MNVLREKQTVELAGCIISTCAGILNCPQEYDKVDEIQIFDYFFPQIFEEKTSIILFIKICSFISASTSLCLKSSSL